MSDRPASSPSRASRPSMNDIAKAAGVSLSTVDRVMNQRGSVKARTQERVLAIAAHLDVAVQPTTIVKEALTFDIVLPAGPDPFLDQLSVELEAAGAEMVPPASIRIHRVAGADGAALAHTLNAFKSTDGVGFVAFDHPLVRDAIRKMSARGIAFATIVSDLGEFGSAGYVGIDNRAAGRLGGQLAGKFIGPREGKVLIIPGHRNYRCHEEREIGFRHIIEDHYPRLSTISLGSRWSLSGLGAEVAEQLKGDHDILAIYNIASGIDQIALALRGHDARKKIVFIAHELTVEARDMLMSGMLDVAIDQDVRAQARALLPLLESSTRSAVRRNIDPIRITPFFRENLP